MVYLANPTARAQNSRFVPVLLPWDTRAACLRDHFYDEKWLKCIAKTTDRTEHGGFISFRETFIPLRKSIFRAL